MHLTTPITEFPCHSNGLQRTGVLLGEEWGGCNLTFVYENKNYIYKK